ncbi:hypothetical protein AUI46_03380 [archaeon 13_1_40CM_2_52_13]|nr:MAG: hypothetical protein AUI46_03380 [archaeon 13_1_40CM_2_52_13]
MLILVVVIIPLLAVFVPWATGYLSIAHGLGGFPAPWRELVFQICPLGIACPLSGCTCNAGKIVQVNIDWLSLGVDILFYTAIGYSIVLVFSRLRP